MLTSVIGEGYSLPFHNTKPMGLFSMGKTMPTFSSRSEAFDFMLAHRLERGDDYDEAAIAADKFADVIAKNKKLPTTPPKPKNGIEKAVEYVEQIAAIKKDHPEVWELVVGGIGGLISSFAVANGNNGGHEELAPAEIDFENLK